MTQTAYWYTAPSAAVPDAIWQLVLSLSESDPDNTVVLVPNRVLKFEALRHMAAQQKPGQPLVYTLDDWVIRHSGVLLSNTVVQHAILDEWMGTKLAEEFPSIPLSLPGVRAHLQALIADSIRYQLRRESMIQVLQSRYVTATATECDAVLSAVVNIRTQFGIIDRLDAYASTPVSPEINTIVLIGFSPTSPVECRWLDCAVGASKTVIVVASSLANSDWNRRLKSILSPNEITMAPEATPQLSRWQCDGAAQQADLVVRLVKSELQQSNFDASRIVIVVSSPTEVAGWTRVLGQADIGCMTAPSTGIVETDIGKLVTAFVALCRSRGRWQAVRDVVEIAYRLGWFLELSPSAQWHQYHLWVRSGVVLKSRWWAGDCPAGADGAFWTWIQTHVTPIIDQSGMAQLTWLSQTIRVMGCELAGRIPVNAWGIWGAVIQTLEACHTRIAQIPSMDWAAVVLKAIQSGYDLGLVNPSGIRVLTLLDAATVTADSVIVPNATGGRWGVAQCGPSEAFLRAKLGLGSGIDAIKTQVLATFHNASRSIHLVIPDHLDGERQAGSGLITSVAHQFNGGGSVIRATLPLPSPKLPETVAIPNAQSQRERYSVSRLSAYRVCPRQYALRYEHHASDFSVLDWEWSAKEKGIVLHLLIENALIAIQSGRDPVHWIKAHAPGIIGRYVSGEMGRIMTRRLIGNGDQPGLIWTILPDLQAFCQNYHIIAIERPLSVWVSRHNRNPIQITGVADVVARHIETGVGVVIDIKTSSTAVSASVLTRMDHLQLPIYRLGLGLDGIPIHVGFIWQLGKSLTQRCVMVDDVGRKHLKSIHKNARPMDITPEYDAALMDHLEWIVDQIERGDFRTDGIEALAYQTGHRSACRSCSYSIGCAFSKRYTR